MKDPTKTFIGGMVIGLALFAAGHAVIAVGQSVAHFITTADAAMAAKTPAGYVPQEYCSFSDGARHNESMLMLDYNVTVEALARRDTDPAEVAHAQCKYWADYVNARSDYKMTCD